MSPRGTQTGASLAEVLVGGPVLLLLGLGVLQLGLWFHARDALNHASFEAARAAAVGHAQVSALESGFARGIAPWLYKPNSVVEMELKVLQAKAHMALAQASGWMSLKIISPTKESFDDWAVPARDSLGYPIDGLSEIPNDNLPTLARLVMPTTGADGTVQGMSIGQASQQTLLDANELKIHGHYGVPLNVPLIGPLVAKALQMLHGCTAPAPQHLAALKLQAPSNLSANEAWKCAYYSGRDTNGKWAPRMPMELAATVRMQSAARKSDHTTALAFSPSQAPSLGPGSVSAPETATVQPVRPGTPTDRPEWGQQLPSLPSVQVGVGGGAEGSNGGGAGSLTGGDVVVPPGAGGASSSDGTGCQIMG